MLPRFVAGLLCFLLLVLTQSVSAADWIWASATPGDNETAYFRRSFQLPADFKTGGEVRIAVSADNHYVLFVNGKRIADGDQQWQTAEVYDVGSVLVPGANVIAIQARNAGGPAGLMVEGKWQLADRVLDVSSNKEWTATTALVPGWMKTADLKWQAAHVFGEVGKVGPWGGVTIAKTVTKAVATTPKKAARKPFVLQDGDAVVWLGGTFIERAQRYGWLEAELHARFNDRKIRFRNLGWSADTVLAESRGIFDAPSQGYARMLEWVKGIKPTVIVLNYGGNESFNGEAGLPTFVANYEKLLDDLAATNAELVLMTPHLHLAMPAPLPSPEQRNRHLKLYGDAIVELAEARQLPVVDLRKLDWKGIPATQVSDNGLHFNDLGNRVIAAQVPDLWFGSNEAPAIRITSGKSEVTGGKLTNLSASSDSAKFEWANAAVRSAQQVTLQVAGLKDGKYAVVVDGAEVAKVSAIELTKGAPVSLSTAKQAAAVELLRQKVVEKDTMFFHRWRPQNVTYLFLFRKHEQGNNAKEVDDFENIVSKLDDEVHRLKLPVVQTVEVRRAAD